MIGIIILILLGILLFLIEFLIIPGVTVAGIGGLILLGSGVYMAFENFDTQTGFIVLVITLIASVMILVFALRSKTWKGAMLTDKISGKVNTGPEDNVIQAGDRGVTVTRLNPIGKIRVNDVVMEGKSLQGYLDPKTEIEVLKIAGSQAIVKPIK
jgi:membrane-bound ClpP family serine protease